MTRRHVGLVVAVLVVAGCASEPADVLPSATGVAVDGVLDTPEATADATSTPTPSPTTATPSPVGTPTPSDGPSSSVDAAAPGPAIVAALVDREVEAAGDGAEHVVVDLDGDDVDEVVVAARGDDRVQVRVWWWTRGRGFGQPVVAEAGPGPEVRGIHVGDVTGDATVELLVAAGDGARGSLAVWTVTDRSLVPRSAVGGCNDGTHVYGVTGARLQARPGGPPAILATCQDIELPLRDRTTAVYEFRDGAFRFVAPRTPSPSPSPTPSPTASPSSSPDPSPNPEPTPTVGDGGPGRGGGGPGPGGGGPGRGGGGPGRGGGGGPPDVPGPPGPPDD